MSWGLVMGNVFCAVDRIYYLVGCFLVGFSLFPISWNIFVSICLFIVV